VWNARETSVHSEAHAAANGGENANASTAAGGGVEWQPRRLKPAVQARLEALNPNLTVKYVAANLYREPTAYGKAWTPNEVAQASELTADHCYFAIFPSGMCEPDAVGKVYRVAPSWFNRHPGGPYAYTANKCGAVVEDWLVRTLPLLSLSPSPSPSPPPLVLSLLDRCGASSRVVL